MDERIKSSIEKVTVKMGDDVADAFGKKVRAVLDDVNGHQVESRFLLMLLRHVC